MPTPAQRAEVHRQLHAELPQAGPEVPLQQALHRNQRRNPGHLPARPLSTRVSEACPLYEQVNIRLRSVCDQIPGATSEPVSKFRHEGTGAF